MGIVAVWFLMIGGPLIVVWFATWVALRMTWAGKLEDAHHATKADQRTAITPPRPSYPVCS